ncbi:hypothetical protein CRG98_018485 [Punica granatum]|uniref:Uncharacterized protein n=1 Tax=Punica granatum TaxID=22663 RepID=A0A2I0JXZ8_PUNGR|nr:hypothetical protein CRG98_018485 [Punica granatum]
MDVKIIEGCTDLLGKESCYSFQSPTCVPYVVEGSNKLMCSSFRKHESLDSACTDLNVLSSRPTCVRSNRAARECSPSRGMSDGHA